VTTDTAVMADGADQRQAGQGERNQCEQGHAGQNFPVYTQQ
jgi:hypothetical protein